MTPNCHRDGASCLSAKTTGYCHLRSGWIAAVGQGVMPVALDEDSNAEPARVEELAGSGVLAD